MLSKEFFNVLKTIERKLVLVSEPWAVYASANLAFRGFNLTPVDIDLVTSEKGIIAIQSALKEFLEKEIVLQKKLLRKAFFAHFKINGIEVEVMAEPENDLIKDFNLQEIELLLFNDLKLPCYKLEKELEVYVKLNRLEKVKLIEEKLSVISE
ncbi:MAG: hypothetical protein ABH821_05790 [archaeon]